MGELFEEFVSIKRSFLVEWSFILVIPNRFAKNPPEVFLSLATLISTCSPMMVMMMMMMMMMLISTCSPISPGELESGEPSRSGESRGSGLVILT